jgi:hypothetical protein
MKQDCPEQAAEALLELIGRIEKHGRLFDLLLSNQAPKVEFKTTFDWQPEEKEGSMAT